MQDVRKEVKPNQKGWEQMELLQRLKVRLESAVLAIRLNGFYNCPGPYDIRLGEFGIYDLHKKR